MHKKGDIIRRTRAKVSIVRGIPELFDRENFLNVKKEDAVKKFRKLEEKNIITDKANQELLAKISGLQMENIKLRDELAYLKKIMDEKKEHYSVMIRMLKMEEKDRVEKLLKDSLEKEMSLDAEIGKLKGMILNQSRIIEEKKNKEKELLILVNSKLREI